MVDIVLVLALGALVVRGWMRGFLREAIGLATLVAGTILAFRLSTPVGRAVATMVGTSPEASRLIAGVIIFTAIAVAAGFLARTARRGIHLLPGMPTVDRIAGAALAGGAGLVVATLLLSILTLLPLPAAVADPIADSRAAETLTDPEGRAQQLLDLASGDGVFGVTLRLDDLVGAPRVGDPGEGVTVLPVPQNVEVRHRPQHGATLFDLVNRARVTAGEAPLAANAPLDKVARGQARRMYESGRMAHVAPNGAGPGDRLDAAGIPHVAVVEVIGLGASPDAVVEAWLSDRESQASLTSPDLRRAGVAALSGPLGLMLVIVAAS